MLYLLDKKRWNKNVLSIHLLISSGFFFCHIHDWMFPRNKNGMKISKQFSEQTSRNWPINFAGLGASPVWLRTYMTFVHSRESIEIEVVT